MKTAIIALTALLTEWYETCASGEPSPFSRRMGFQSTRARCDRLGQQCAQEDGPREVEVIWAIIPLQQLLGEWRGLVCTQCPGHISHSQPPPSQSIQQSQCFQWAFISAEQAFEGCHVVL